MVGEPEAKALDMSGLLPARPASLTPKGRRALLIAGDLIVTVVSILGALAVWAYRSKADFGYQFVRANWTWLPVLVIFWYAAAAVNDLYRPSLVGDFGRLTRRVFRAQVIVVGFYLLIYFISQPRSLPRGVVGYYAAIATPLLFAWRWLSLVIFSRQRFSMRALVIGAGWAGATAAGLIQEHLTNECTLLGFVDDDAAKQGKVTNGVRVLGNGRSLLDLVRLNSVDLLVVAITHGMNPDLFRNILLCQQAGVAVVSMTSLYEQTLERTPVHHLGEQWFLSFEPPELLTQAVKRAIDVGFACLALLGFALILPFLALAIRLDSRGPIFYKQQRVGRNGRIFWVHKLRSMVPDAERHGAQWAIAGDPRVTRVGRVLRKTRLDEIPQVWNILKGDMSLIGPRPERPEFVAKLQEEIPYYRSRLSVKPGLTGWAQVRYRYGNSVEDARIKLEYDLYYIKHQSLLLDLSIALRTIGVVLSMGGT